MHHLTPDSRTCPDGGARIDYLTAADLDNLGIDPSAVQVLCPWAVTYTALDGSPCWSRDDIASLWGEAP